MTWPSELFWFILEDFVIVLKYQIIFLLSSCSSSYCKRFQFGQNSDLMWFAGGHIHLELGPGILLDDFPRFCMPFFWYLTLLHVCDLSKYSCTNCYQLESFLLGSPSKNYLHPESCDLGISKHYLCWHWTCPCHQ